MKSKRKTSSARKSGKPRGGKKPFSQYVHESGPLKWLLPIRESSYARLEPVEEAREKPVRPSGHAPAFRSRLSPGRGEDVLAPAPADLWEKRLREYQRRRHDALGIGPGMVARVAPSPIVPGQKNWSPLGPSVVTRGQAVGNPPVGGRVPGIAVAPGGKLVYAASANGGVFRSDDGGLSWRALMDSFDVDPTNFASTSLASGAIAIDLKDPNRIYVGTGEGDTYAIFSNRLTNALPAYRGIGPIRSDDGGSTWQRESTAPDSPSLAGEAFFALAVNPANREHVVAATSKGLYERNLQPGGAPRWTRRETDVHSSVVVASAGGVTHFFAAGWGKSVIESKDGAQWNALGTQFPSSNVSRITLGVQPTNPDLVYAVVADSSGGLLGIYRFDRARGSWKAVAAPPKVLPDDGKQGDYDLAVAVDPADGNLIYVGGSYYSDGLYWPGSIWRCKVQSTGSGYKMAGTSIGTRVHADVHVLTHSPGDPNQLWTGCDGGVFLNQAPRTTDSFSSRNTGLACLCTNFFAQHPTDPGTMLVGLQDNGTALSHAGALWKHVNGGDGGYCLINWAQPLQALCFANGTVYRATDGGDSGSWTSSDFSWAMMTEPIVGTPYDPAHPASAKLVGLGAGADVYISNDFGATWPGNPTVTVPTNGGVYAMTFASASRFFVGTTESEVFRGDKIGSTWRLTRIDNVAAGRLPLRGLVSDIAIDWQDPSLASIYLAFGGVGDYRHVWRFDGNRWQAASGPPGTSANLLDVEHNAMVVDRSAPANVYVGADIGVWHSPDRGQSWRPLSNGLPDAPVFDLQIHPTRRLLRASTHGRGLYEYPL